MGKNPSRKDPLEQILRYVRIFAWVSITVAVSGFGYLVYMMLNK